MKIFDTTLRDGMQTPGIGCNLEKRLQIAEAIAKCNVDVMEIGMPANPIDKELMPTIADHIYDINPNVEICVLCRGQPLDVSATKEVYAKIKNPKRVHLFVPTSTTLRENSIRKSEEEVLEVIRYFVKEFQDYKLEFSPEDAARTDLNFLMKVLDSAKGTSIFNLPDTTGWVRTVDYGNMFKAVLERYETPLSAHCHNDSGMAVANSMSAVENGATQVEGTVLGIGERSGNVDWMHVVANLNMNGYKVNVDMKKFIDCAETVSKLIGVNIPPNYPIVGTNFRRTSSGVHGNAVARSSGSYHLFDPKLLGVGVELVLGQTSGKAVLESKLKEYGIKTNGNFPEVLDKVMRYCMENGTIEQQELAAFCF